MSLEMDCKLGDIVFRRSTFEDAVAAARLHSVGDPKLYDSLIPIFQDEFQKYENEPQKRTYFLAFNQEDLVALAGARFYDQKHHENLYKTKKLLPTGWYLRGIRVHRNWQRQGIAKTMTLLRLGWLFEKSDTVYVF